MNARFRTLLSWTRSLHIYASLLSFCLLFFFTVTGWLLVHAESFGLDRVNTSRQSLDIPLGITESSLVEWMRGERLAAGQVLEMGDRMVQFRRAGESVYAEFDLASRRMEITKESSGVIGRILDLHRNSLDSRVGRWIADLCAGLFLILSLSGLILWIPLSRRRRIGIALLATGGLVLMAIWAVF